MQRMEEKIKKGWDTQIGWISRPTRVVDWVALLMFILTLITIVLGLVVAAIMALLSNPGEMILSSGIVVALVWSGVKVLDMIE